MRHNPILALVTCLTCGDSIPVKIEDPSAIGSAGFRWRMEHFNRHHKDGTSWQFRAEPISHTPDRGATT